MSGAAPFFGQASLVRRILSRLGAERPQSVAVIGGRGSGKTSLLRHLARPEILAGVAGDAESFLLVTVDAPSGRAGGRGGGGEAPAGSPRPDAAALLERFALGLGGAGSDGGAGYESIRERVEVLHGQGRRIGVFLDDFHLVTGSDEFPLEFFSFLRSLANNYNLAYVTTSLLELQALCAAKEIQESPFFNIFTNMHLGPLGLPEAAQLLAEVADRGQAECEPLASWCGGHPASLVALGRLVADGGLTLAAGDRDLVSRGLPALAVGFADILSSLPAEAFRPLQAVAKGRSLPVAECHLLTPLVKQGFLFEDESRLRPASQAFALFIERMLQQGMLAGRPC